MKFKLISLTLISLLFSGCGEYQSTVYTYEEKSPLVLKSNIKMFGHVHASLIEEQRGIFNQWFDVYSEPYTLTLRLRVYLKDKPIHPLIIHSVKLSDKESIIREITPDNPLTISIEKPYQTSSYFEAVYRAKLDKYLNFKDDHQLNLQIEWAIPEIEERQISESEFISKTSTFTCSKFEYLLD